MKEVKGHIYHRHRKWKCPNCNKVKMQKQKETTGF
jgi:transposase-like protein